MPQGPFLRNRPVVLITKFHIFYNKCLMSISKILTVGFEVKFWSVFWTVFWTDFDEIFTRWSDIYGHSFLVVRNIFCPPEFFLEWLTEKMRRFFMIFFRMVNLNELFFVTKVVGKILWGIFLIGRIVYFPFHSIFWIAVQELLAVNRKIRISAGCTPPNLKTYFFGPIVI